MPEQSIYQKFPLVQGTAQLILIRYDIGFHLQANGSFHAVYHFAVSSSQALAWPWSEKGPLFFSIQSSNNSTYSFFTWNILFFHNVILKSLDFLACNIISLFGYLEDKFRDIYTVMAVFNVKFIIINTF